MARYQHILDKALAEVYARYPHAHFTFVTCKTASAASLFRYDKKHKGKIHYEFEMPTPDTTKNLAACLHEIGHLLSGHLTPSELAAGTIISELFYRHIPARRKEQEYEASMWALTFMTHHGITVRNALPYLSHCLFRYGSRMCLKSALEIYMNEGRIVEAA